MTRLLIRTEGTTAAMATRVGSAAPAEPTMVADQHHVESDAGGALGVLDGLGDGAAENQVDAEASGGERSWRPSHGKIGGVHQLVAIYSR